jgi:hypothetical protein
MTGIPRRALLAAALMQTRGGLSTAQARSPRGLHHSEPGSSDSTTPPSGNAETWLAEWASTYKDNPMVRFRTQNEPHRNAHGISRMMRAMHDAECFGVQF